MTRPKPERRPQCTENRCPNCDICGRFVKLADLAKGTARTDVIMSMDVGGHVSEIWVSYCRRCA